MTDKEKTTDESTAQDSEENGEGSEKDDKRPDDTLADQKTCPECGTPIDDVRATCINCGYEYKDEDHEDAEAGNEFMAGSQIDDEGNEIPEDPDEDGDDEASQDSDDSDSSDDSSEDSDDSEDSDEGPDSKERDG